MPWSFRRLKSELYADWLVLWANKCVCIYIILYVYIIYISPGMHLRIPCRKDSGKKKQTHTCIHIKNKQLHIYIYIYIYWYTYIYIYYIYSHRFFICNHVQMHISQTWPTYVYNFICKNTKDRTLLESPWGWDGPEPRSSLKSWKARPFPGPWARRTSRSPGCPGASEIPWGFQKWEIPNSWMVTLW